jgi:hypothetical protein
MSTSKSYDKEHPIGSKWKNKATGCTYKITELLDTGLWIVIKLENKHSVCLCNNCDIWLNFKRV